MFEFPKISDYIYELEENIELTLDALQANEKVVARVQHDLHKRLREDGDNNNLSRKMKILLEMRYKLAARILYYNKVNHLFYENKYDYVKNHLCKKYSYSDFALYTMLIIDILKTEWKSLWIDFNITTTHVLYNQVKKFIK